ncbi:hypothetical protein [Streptomyces cyaneofuscatus]|uniref:hypothetical protein n=1 Tax=Streptomyces cyaneofuscatus TaxID=66883 RepID=UPI00364266D9
MAAIKLNLVKVHDVLEMDDRRVRIYATDQVRGEIMIDANEDEARWLWASLDSKVQDWRRADLEY